MSYTVISESKRNNTYNVRETVWGIVIELGLSKSQANVLCRKLNLGSGFGTGPIPEFFCSKTKN
jgi:hypothetical protein|tara:strand:- start:1187 stop:1378 length:192 start_codon:yes stop_codon:yes gene_type:complete